MATIRGDRRRCVEPLGGAWRGSPRRAVRAAPRRRSSPAARRARRSCRHAAGAPVRPAAIRRAHRLLGHRPPALVGDMDEVLWARAVAPLVEVPQRCAVAGRQGHHDRVTRLRDDELVLDPVVADVGGVELEVDAAPPEALSLARQSGAAVEAGEQERQEQRVVDVLKKAVDLLAVVEVVAAQDTIVVLAVARARDVGDDVRLHPALSSRVAEGAAEEVDVLVPGLRGSVRGLETLQLQQFRATTRHHREMVRRGSEVRVPASALASWPLALIADPALRAARSFGASVRWWRSARRLVSCRPA